MPLYEFECCHCKNKFDRIVKSDVILAQCDDCGHIATKVKAPTKANFKLNGSGVYNKLNPK